MKDEYIRKSDAEKALRILRRISRRIEEICAVNACILEIEDLPSMDAVKIAPERCWFCDDYDKLMEIVCYLPHDSGDSTSVPINYCPHCGVKVGGDDEK